MRKIVSLHVPTKGICLHAVRSAGNDVRVTLCSVHFGQKLEFARTMVMSTEDKDSFKDNFSRKDAN